MVGKKLPIYAVVYYFFLLIATVVTAIPLIWMISGSFDRIQSFELPYPPRFFPANPSLFNYQMVLINLRIVQFMTNTIIVAFFGTIGQLIVASLAGFAFSKGQFPFKAIMLIIIMSNLMVPIETRLLPLFMITRDLGLVNTHTGIILPGLLTNAFFIFLMKKFCDDLPYDLYESAVLDGAPKFRIYAQIYLPLMGPALATLAVLEVMNLWNDLLWPMIVTNRIEMATLQVGLAMFSSGTDAIQHHAGMVSAASIMSILPLAVVFCCLQKYIVQSIAVSGMKQ